ncbi:MAG: peptidoglycan-binding domain-containing protein [Bryobacterales bacterium]|nr:peptidoglycan-binding protein [Bryobacteraceae bacterium]MDW8130774.1 peptidoglycan-binding domain-containing protein [Bryobacterales bacterium]
MRRPAAALILFVAAALVPAGWQASASGASAGGRLSSAQRSNTPALGKPAPGGAVAKPSTRKSSRTAGAKRKNIRRPTSSKSRTARARAQQAPTPERYAEIQRALIERGYLEGPATGNWGPESVEALKRFQQEHNLEATGKINALTLIALGLGPNRASRASSAPSAAADGHQAGEKPE